MFKILKFKNDEKYEERNFEVNINSIASTFKRQGYEVTRTVGKNHIILSKLVEQYVNDSCVEKDLYTIEIKPF